MAIEITGRQFTPQHIKRFATKYFKNQGLEFLNEAPEIAKKLTREGGFGGLPRTALTHVTFTLKSGLKLRLGIKFDIKSGKIQPESKGIVYNAKLGSSAIPLARPKGEDYDWSSFIEKISKYIKEKEKNLKPKGPSVSKAQATDNKTPNTYGSKLESKTTLRDEKKTELAKQKKSLEDQEKKNELLKTEIEGFKKLI